MNKKIFIIFLILLGTVIPACSLLEQLQEIIHEIPIPEITPTPLSTPNPTPLPTSTPEIMPTPIPTITPVSTATPTITPLPDNILINGFAEAEVSDVSISENIAYTSGTDWYIQYAIPTLSDGYVEFMASGFTQDELHGGTEFKSMLISMWDENQGYDYSTASFIAEIRKYGYIEGRPDASNAFKIKIKSQDIWTESDYAILDWNPDTIYSIRIEWQDSILSVWRDNIKVLNCEYIGMFAPIDHIIRIGASKRGKPAPDGLIIWNVEIGKILFSNREFLCIK